VTEGLSPDGLVLLNAPSTDGLDATRVECVPASRLAAARGSKFVNLVMVGALAAALGEPSAEEVADAAAALLGKKAAANDIRDAVLEGYACLS
jgi:Pyruvate/2-oxoacid:ferredoxin oxidoreductase gamma subunit